MKKVLRELPSCAKVSPRKISRGGGCKSGAHGAQESPFSKGIEAARAIEARSIEALSAKAMESGA